MNSIRITLEVTKFNKAKITERKYTKKDGQEVTAKEYRVELVELKEPKVIKSGDGWELRKTHFVIEEQTKAERDLKASKVYVGEGFTFVSTDSQETTEVTVDNTDEINPDDIPF